MRQMVEGEVSKGQCLAAAAAALKGRAAVVVGLGATGLAASRFLAGRGASVVAVDSKDEARLPGAPALRALGVDVRAGGLGVGLSGVDLVVVSPGVPGSHPLIREAGQAGVEVISEVELAWRFMDAPMLAVAGTNGKTTTTALLGEALREAGFKVFVGGNIGTPAVEYVEGGGGADLCVLEVSSFQLETIRRFRPHIGVLLNITEDHLDRYRDFGHYADTKLRLFENQTESDYAVVNALDPAIAERASSLGRGRVVRFAVGGAAGEGLSLEGGSIVHLSGGNRQEYPLEGIRLKGLHNVENAMAAIAASRLAGAPAEAVKRALASFSGLGHRMELVRELGGVTYMDDSKGTNIGALAMALKGLAGPVVLIAGGVDKGGDYRALDALVREKVKLMVLIGEARFKIREALGGSAPAVLAGSLEEAVAAASLEAAGGDTVLLCPACSSFDMFRDYKERGERFRSLVEAL